MATRTVKTPRERAEYRLGVAQRFYERAVIAHAKAAASADTAYVVMAAAAETLQHRKTDPALAPQSPLGGN